MRIQDMTAGQLAVEIVKNLAWLAGFGAFILVMWWALAPAPPM